jgi:hypothetical protein
MLARQCLPIPPSAIDRARHARATPRPAASARAIWRALAAVALVDAIWLATADFHLVLSSVVLPTFFVGVFAVTAALFRRWGRNPPAVALLDGIAQIIACFTLCGVLSYLVVSTNRPSVEDAFVAVDAMVGFDWPSVVGWVQAHPLIDAALFSAYYSVPLQLVAVTGLLGLIRRERIQELSTTILITLLATIAISGLVPALDAYSYFAPTHPELSVEQQVHDFLPLRSGALRAIDLRKLEGLICAPSFHTILALLFAYSLRGIRGAFPASIILNTGVVLSTFSAGSHYLTDILAAFTLTAVVLALYRVWPWTVVAAARPRATNPWPARRGIPPAAILATSR